MAQEGQSPVLVFDSPVMVLHSLVLVFTQSSFNFYRVQFWFLHSPVLIFTQCSLFLHSPVLFLHGQQSSFIFCVVTRPLSLYCNIQGGKTFCASFCASLIAGSRRAFLCVCWVCSTVFVCYWEKFWLRLNKMHKVWTFSSRKAFLLLCGFCFSSLTNYFGLEQPMLREKRIIPVSLRWNKKFSTFPKRRVFFWLCFRFIGELISPSFAGLN